MLLLFFKGEGDGGAAPDPPEQEHYNTGAFRDSRGRRPDERKFRRPSRSRR